MNKCFIIYVDGGSKVCLGHIMRTMTLARAMRVEGIDVIFVTSSSDAVDMIEKDGFSCQVIDKLDYNILCAKIRENFAKGILVDKFGFKNEEHEIVKKESGLLVQIDDFLYAGPADIVINTTISKKPDGRKGEWLCGGDYAIIRECFVNRNKIIVDEPQNILVTTGYGDPSNTHMKCIEAIRKVVPDATIHVVVGNGYTTQEELKRICDKKIVLYHNITDLSELMHLCDFAVTSAGTTLYEMAAAGLPAIAFSLYDNQIDNIGRVANIGSIYAIGWHEEITNNKIEQAIEKVAKDKDLRLSMSQKGVKWIDGKGASRIAKAIYERL